MAEEESPWFPIATAPTDDQEFYVGKWHGEMLWNEDYTEFVWAKTPEWVQDISHHENPQGPHRIRGWNHRNGALGGKATHWAKLIPPPPLTDPIAVQS